MKPYGNSRRDNQTCRYGCCHGQFVKGGGIPVKDTCKARSRKKARQEGRREADEALKS